MLTILILRDTARYCVNWSCSKNHATPRTCSQWECSHRNQRVRLKRTRTFTHENVRARRQCEWGLSGFNIREQTVNRPRHRAPQYVADSQWDDQTWSPDAAYSPVGGHWWRQARRKWRHRSTRRRHQTTASVKVEKKISTKCITTVWRSIDVKIAKSVTFISTIRPHSARLPASILASTFFPQNPTQRLIRYIVAECYYWPGLKNVGFWENFLGFL